MYIVSTVHGLQGMIITIYLTKGRFFIESIPNGYMVMILQYVIRKYFLYKQNLTMRQAYQEMKKGANACKAIYGGKIERKAN